MGVKHRRGKTRRHRSSRRRHTRRRTHHRRNTCIRGGNYSTDVTTRTFENFPMKDYNKVVTSVPGRGVMSVSAYKRLMEDEERNGFDFYD
jgi:hypothetical protein